MTQKIKLLTTKDQQLIASKSNLHYTRGITPKRVTSGEIHRRGLASGQHKNGTEVVNRWQQHMSNLTGPRIKLKTSRTDSDIFNHQANWPMANTFSQAKRNVLTKSSTEVLSSCFAWKTTGIEQTQWCALVVGPVVGA